MWGPSTRVGVGSVLITSSYRTLSSGPGMELAGSTQGWMSKWMNGVPRRRNLSGACFLQTLPHYCPYLALLTSSPSTSFFLNGSNVPTQGLSSERSDGHMGKLLSSGSEISILPRTHCNRMFIVQMNYFDSREKLTWSRLMRRKMIVQFTKRLHVIPRVTHLVTRFAAD